MPPALPFPLVWSAPLPGNGTCNFRPVLAGGAVIWRSDEVVGAIDAVDGATRWIRTLPEDAGEGDLLVRCGALTITDGWRDDLSTLIALDDRGAIAWEAATELVLARGGVIGADGRALVAGIATPRGAWVLSLALDGGAVTSRRPLPLGGTSVVPVPAGLLVCNPAAAVDRPGLYLLDDGDHVRELARGKCWLALRCGDLVVTLNNSGPAELIAREVATLEPRWRALVSDAGADADDDAVASIERDGDVAMLVLRDLVTGALRWRVRAHAAGSIFNATLAGPLISLASSGRRDYFRRADGRWLGSLAGLVSPPVADDRHVYFGAAGLVMAATIA